MRTLTGSRLDVDALEQRVHDGMRSARVPSLALGVVSGDELVYARGFGTTSVEDGGTPVTAATEFRIASVTKVLTGTMVMRLVEDGVLELDRPVIDYLPWFRLRTPGAAERVTLRMLLAHTAGLPEAQPLVGGRRDRDALEARVRHDAPRFPLVAPPGRLYSYSNLGIDIAGFVVQDVTGTPFDALLQQLVLDPLGMTRTTLDPTVAMTYPLARGHAMDDDGRPRVVHDGGDNASSYPSGLAWSTVEDVARLVAMFLNGGEANGRRVLSEEGIARMHAPAADLMIGRGLRYGITFLIEPSYKGVVRVGHEGVLGGYAARVTLAPAERVGVIMLYTNDALFYPAREEIFDAIFDDLLGLPRGPVRHDVVEADRRLWPLLVGSYEKILDLKTVNVFVDGDRLSMRFDGVTMPLTAVGGDVYVGTVPDRELPRVPWPRTPYVLADRVSLGFLLDDDAAPCPYLAVNGQPYRRAAKDPPERG